MHIIKFINSLQFHNDFVVADEIRYKGRCKFLIIIDSM